MQRLVSRQLASAFLATSSSAAVAQQRRPCSHDVGMKGFTDVRFNTQADRFIEHVMSTVDAMEHPLIDDCEVSDGVLDIETPQGKFVVNKQAPRMQLWLSSPITGPHHYDMTDKKDGEAEDASARWESDRDQHDLQAKLEKELAGIHGTDVKF